MNDNGNHPQPDELRDRIESGLKMLARYRQRNDEARQALIEIIQALEDTPEYQHWNKCKAEAECEISQAEKYLRADVLSYYAQTGAPPPDLPVGVRRKTSLEYGPDDAIEWAGKYLPRALSLDRQFFEKHARAVADTTPLPFVQIVVEMTATIGQDLSEFLVARVEPEGSPE